jgi:hypothetical protein
MRILIVLFASILPFSDSFSQQFADSDGKWEVGLNVLPYIDSSFLLLKPSWGLFQVTGSLSNSVLVRRELSEYVKLRGSAGLAFRNTRTEETPYEGGRIISQSIRGGYLALGSEYYVRTGRVSVYFGGAVSGLFLYSRFRAEDTMSPIPPTIYKLEENRNTAQIGLEGLAGVNVRIFSSFYVSLETTALVALRRLTYDYVQFDGEDAFLSVVGNSVRRTFIAELNSPMSLHLVYKF